MPFRLPNFALTVNIWHNGSTAYASPSLTTTGNLTPGRRVAIEQFATAANSYLLLPAHTDIRAQFNGTPDDIVECPAGSKVFWQAVSVVDVAKGFANEHRMAYLLLLPGGSFGFPFPVPLP